MRWLAIVALCSVAQHAVADIVVAQRTLRPKTIIQPEDVAVRAGELAGAYDLAAAVVGLETRVAIYPGRPVRFEDVGPPATIERNQLVDLIYIRRGLRIVAEGRALGRGAPGERVRVMNVSSKSTLTGTIRQDGAIEIR
ncbi:MAG: flagellar basal body P-ring formation chaperone FlgA [Pseudomonadota bacterium]